MQGTPSKADQIDLAATPEFELAGLSVRPSTREIVRGDFREALQPRLMQVLVALAQERGEVVSHERLFQRCWEGRVVGDDALHRAIAKLRRIGEAQDAFAIQSIARVGYRLTVSDAGHSAAAPGRRRMRVWAWPAAAVLVLGIGALAAVAIPRPSRPIRVSVQAFTASASNPEATAVAARVRDQIIATLTARQINVPAKASPSANLIIAGMVEESGGTARIRVHVDDPRSDQVLWNRVFEGSSQAGGPLAEQAAAKITDIVGGGVDVLRSGKGRVAGEALKSWMLGLDAWRQGQVLEPREFYRGFREAAPRLSVAQARFALATAQALPAVPADIAKTWRQEANEAVGRSVALDPHEPVAYYARYLLADRRDYAARRTALREGLRMAPADGSLNVNYGILLTETGRPREGLAYIRKGFAVDPLSPPKSFGVAINMAGAGELEEARATLRRARRIWPGVAQQRNADEFFAVEYAEPAEARQILADLGKSFPDMAAKTPLWTTYLDSLACRCNARPVAKALVAATDGGRIEPDIAIAALIRLGDTDTAFALARTYLPTGRARAGNFLFSAVAGPLRQEPRFMDLAAHLDLIRYWQASGDWPEYCVQPSAPYDCKAEAARALSAAKLAQR